MSAASNWASALDAKKIASEASIKHVQSVIEDAKRHIITLESQRIVLLAALAKMNRAYVNLLENGRDRIVMLGGQCDSVDVMEASDTHLRESRAVIAKLKGGAA